MPRSALFLLLFALTGCPAAPEPTVTVVHRCGDLNFDALQGLFGRLEGKTGINSKFRLKALTEGDKPAVHYVGGDDRGVRFVGSRTGNETFDFDAVEGNRRLQLGLSSDCRLTVADGNVLNGAFQARPGGEMQFAPFGDLARLDFEPCTGRLFVGAAAKSEAASKKAGPEGEVPSFKSDSTRLGAWGPKSELAAGCEPRISVYVNGEAEVLEDPLDAQSGDRIAWTTKIENNYVGRQNVSLHRLAVCDGVARVLGAACATYEVK